jgi:hypothetical protein
MKITEYDLNCSADNQYAYGGVLEIQDDGSDNVRVIIHRPYRTNSCLGWGVASNEMLTREESNMIIGSLTICK